MKIRVCKESVIIGVIVILSTMTSAASTSGNPSVKTPASAQLAVVGEQVNWQVFNGGGTDGSSASYRVSVTVGQTAVGGATSASFGLNCGYQQDFGGGSSNCCVGLTGNVDGDPVELIDLGDLTALIDYLFISFTPPVCMEEANVDGDLVGLVDLGDLTALIDYLFISFTPPAPCL